MKTMEGILLDTIVNPGTLLAALAVTILVLGRVLLGRVAEEEAAGQRLYWAEWPLPEGEEPSGQELARRVA